MSKEGDIRNSDDGSIEDHERNSWVDWCNSAFWNGISTFPSDADNLQPMVVFSDKLFSDEVLADTPVSVHEEVPVLALQVFTDEGVPLVPPVIDQTVRRVDFSGQTDGRSLGTSLANMLSADSSWYVGYGIIAW